MGLDKGLEEKELTTRTLANDGTDLSPFYDFDDKISQDVKDCLAEINAGIIDGIIDPLA